MFSHHKIIPSRSALFDILMTAALAACLAALYVGTIYEFDSLPIVALCLGAGAALGGGWLLKRAILDKARLPRAGFELWLVLFLVGALLSVLFSGYPRIGLEKLGWYLFLSILFYALLDLTELPLLRLRVQQVLLIFTGLTLFFTLLETYTHYLIWWGLAGSQSISPPHPYRFVSVVVQSNMFMGLVNMLAPLALVLFLKARGRTGRFFGALWMVMYVVAVPFSSSRGGWLGAAVWISVLGGLWLVDGGRWLRWIHWLRERWVIGLAGVLAGVAACGYAAYKAYMIFAAANPSHGSGVNLNREWIWEIAFNAWKESPWTGTGLGSLGQDYLRVIQTHANPWWPGYAHSQPLQILAETGLVGFLPFLGITISVIVLLVRCYRQTPPAQRMNSAAAIAGLAGLFVHGIFDDFSSLPLLVAVVLALIASVITASGPLPRVKGISFGWLAAPALAVLGFAVFYLWSYAPLYTAVSASPEANWQQAAETAEQSALRDPGMAYYHFESAIAWAMAWQQTQNPQALEQARFQMTQGLKIEPNNAVNWADLAVLDWHAGRQDEALAHIRQATEMAPTEPGFPMNWGWFLEEMGRNDEAITQYKQALQLFPTAAAHPFWQLTHTRQAAVSEIQIPVETETPYWKQARALAESGDFAAARVNLAKSYYFYESPVAFGISWAEFETATGNQDNAWFFLEKLRYSLDYAYWTFTIGELDYSRYLSRVDFAHSVVPGFIIITTDVGQFQALERLYQKQAAGGDCAAAARTWAVLQREIHAGEWPSGGYAPAGQCP